MSRSITSCTDYLVWFFFFFFGKKNHDINLTLLLSFIYYSIVYHTLYHNSRYFFLFHPFSLTLTSFFLIYVKIYPVPFLMTRLCKFIFGLDMLRVFFGMYIDFLLFSLVVPVTGTSHKSYRLLIVRLVPLTLSYLLYFHYPSFQSFYFPPHHPNLDRTPCIKRYTYCGRLHHVDTHC